MASEWLHPRRRPRTLTSALATVTLALWLPFVVTSLSWASPAGQPHLPAAHHIIALAPVGRASSFPGRLAHPMNFGYRCTLVDAAAVLNFYGARSPQNVLAVQLSMALGDSSGWHGPPWWAYVALPGRRPQLDTEIEGIARSAGIRVRAQTTVGLSFPAAAAAIAHNQPVILNMARTPDGTYNHSLLAYGYDTWRGRHLLLALDPNSQRSYWIGSDTFWSYTVTSTLITPAHTGR
jgi:hypothetical protein